MKRGKILVVVGMAVALVVVAVAGFVMFQGLSQAAATRGERNAVRDRLASFYQRDPFPNRANVELEKANVETVRTWYERLLADLQTSNIPTNERNPIIFNSRREAMTSELIATAPAGEGGTPVVANDATFGFARYKDGKLARPDDVPRLIRQLRMVELLVKELYGAGVLRLASVTREEFEAATGEGGAPVESAASGRFGGGGGGEAAPTASGSRVEGPVPMDRQRFTFELLANEASLVDLLNRIARMKMFAVVTRVEFSKEGLDYLLAPPVEVVAPSSGPAPASASAPGAAPAAEPPATGGVKLPPPTRTARIVSGRDREATLKVQLDVEVYSFEGEV